MDEVKQNKEEQQSKNYAFKTHYSSFGWFLYWVGMSAKPVQVDFIDRETGEIVSSSTDPEILKKYVGR